MKGFMIIVVILIIFANPIITWHSLGHMLVAEIARERLLKSEPSAILWAEGVISSMRYFCGENRHPFVESAPWADKIRQEGWTSMFNWHFNNRVYKDSKSVKKNYPNDLNQSSESNNVIWSIKEMIKHLKTTTRFERGKTRPIIGQSFSLRNLIHFIGDIHQPLHSGTRVTPKYPNGDEGGNLFIIDHYGPEMGENANNLHFIWDHMFDQFDQDIRSPVSEDEFSKIQIYAKNITSEFSYEELKNQMHRNPLPEDWANESFNIVASFVYKNIQENTSLSKDYISKGQFITRKRIALGGYRLADTISYIFKERNKRIGNRI